ncbi:mannitol dehydrogenase family protein [Actinoplanes sp. URMC 104]|uniref:mannitol dehydrogenase family protein n=1 Tax=Actinoplanes sp. URMC 104 TaxID=3423409 RepID=UPI003F1BA90D
MHSIPLTNRTVASLADRLDVPAYDRTALTPAVVHLGVGGFHRAHQAVYLDDLARTGDTGWGVVGVGLRSARMRDALLPQDCLFTVVERDEHGDTARVVGSMVGYRYAPDDPEAVLRILADPRVRIVTLTITGDGYHRSDHPAVLADLAHPATPTTAAGYLVEALDRRRRRDAPGLTVLSCDNLPDNGAAARATVLGLAGLRDRSLAAWIEAHVSFPAGMVDRITPATDGAARDLVAGRFGVADRCPVVAEPFRQWVVEDDFRAGRPPLERVGVQFVPDVTPYKLMKTRLLNAGHSALGYLGALTGEYGTSSEAMANPVIADYLAVLMREEIAPLLPEVPGIDLDAYQRTVLRRFANPMISDQLARLCGRGSTKMPAYLLPTLAHARRDDRPALLLSLAVAAWFCYLRGYDLNGAPIEVRDRLADVLQARARAGGNDPRPLLAERRLFGPLADDPAFAAMLECALHDLEMYGPAATICDYLATELLV